MTNNKAKKEMQEEMTSFLSGSSNIYALRAKCAAYNRTRGNKQ